MENLDKIEMNRNEYIDNMKGYLAFLVVVGHLISPMKGNFVIAKQLFMFIYIFHMPAFVMISGYLSSDKNVDLKKLFYRIFIPFMIFQLILTFTRFIFFPVTGRAFLYMVTTPQIGLWYIFCLFFWRLILPYIAKIPYSLALSFVAGLLWGFMLHRHNFVYSSSRLIAFFPFFLVGFHIKKHQFEIYKLKTNQYNVIFMLCVAILISALILSLVFENRYQNHFLYFQFYSQTGAPLWFAFLLRAAAYVSAVIVGLSFMVVIPKKRHIMTKIGEGSLYVYLLHLPIVKILYYSNMLKRPTEFYWFAAVVIAGFMLSVFFSLKPIRKLFKFLIEPFPVKAPLLQND